LDKKEKINFKVSISDHVSEIISNQASAHDLYNSMALPAEVSSLLFTIPAFLKSLCFIFTPKYSMIDFRSGWRRRSMCFYKSENKHCGNSISLLKNMIGYSLIHIGILKKLTAYFRFYISINKILASQCFLHIGLLKNLASYCLFYTGILQQLGRYFFIQTGTNFYLERYFSIKNGSFRDLEGNYILQPGPLQLLASQCFLHTGLSKNLASHFLFCISLLKTHNMLIVNKIHDFIT
jgi:hypothetical protein